MEQTSTSTSADAPLCGADDLHTGRARLRSRIGDRCTINDTLYPNLGSASMTKEAQEQLTYVMTLDSQVRVGGYQHEVSSGPWMILAAERAALAPPIYRHPQTGERPWLKTPRW
jgi:hypothetical protein